MTQTARQKERDKKPQDKTSESGAPDPDLAQRRAADPGASVWVGASAGSGKTKVLTDRVLRLLLPREDGKPGTLPQRILCLTFTKAGASEMAMRLNRRLSAWAVMKDEDLAAAMHKLLGRQSHPAERAAARRLFAAVVDTPGALKIMTIHSFCQSLLGRFPLEAGVPPQFLALEESAARELLERARSEILAAARRAPETPLGRSLIALAAEIGEGIFTALVGDIVKEKRQLAALNEDLSQSAESLRRKVAVLLDADPNKGADTLLAGACQNAAFDEKALRRACGVLQEHSDSDKDQQRGRAIQKWLDAAPVARITLYAEYKGAFLTKDGDVVARLMTKKPAESAPESHVALRKEAERILQLEESLKAASCAALTAHLLFMGAAVLSRYEELKKTRAALDFDDLIYSALDLLKKRDMAAWVMYKLDGGLDHVLVDEAQDTNPEQWEIVSALCEEFFAGAGARPEETRTIFTVGDEKQSIYSFQRASPDKFHEMRTWFADRVRAAQQVWRNENMVLSFRSVPCVLRFVDEVFNEEDLWRGLARSPPAHESHREGQGGLVELWPLFGTAGKEDRNPWTVPLKPVASRNGSARLAEHIGDTIAGWLAKGDVLVSKNRKVAAGDILILVRRRTAFVNQLIRALKVRKVPVSGLDRMILKDQLAVRDLVVASQVALLPEDDLGLACLLKSPFIGWTDEQLEAMATGRLPGQSLWAHLVAAGDVLLLSWLRDLIRRAAAEPPYEFFSHLLQMPCPADPVSGLHAICGHLGAEALDPLDEFLNAALKFEANHIAALQGFLRALEQGDTEIKREQESSGGRVRIMTVHGAKGLQAPIVILPDTTRITRLPAGENAQRLIWPDKSGLSMPVWSPRKTLDSRVYTDIYNRFADRQDEEYRRLLYVALTRAEDRLYIAGYTGRRGHNEDSWYNYMSRALGRLPGIKTQAFESRHWPPSAATEEGLEDEPLLTRFSGTQKDSEPVAESRQAPETRAAPDPEKYPWLRRPAPVESDPPRPLMPSRPAEKSVPARSPLDSVGDEYRFRRGVVTHRLLQFLPGVMPEERAEAAHRFVNVYAADLPEPVRAGVARETLTILNDPAGMPLFGPDSQAEVPVTGMAGGRLISGQIDRLVVREREVWIVDYKTNRPPPVHEKDVPPLYRQQMKLYRDIVSNIYKGRAVRCFLLWTDGPHLLELLFPAP